jgi:hypothetical protein
VNKFLLIKITIIAIVIVINSSAFCWEEDPRIEEHNFITSKLYRLAQQQTGTDQEEEKLIEEKSAQELQRFLEKTTKRRKSNGN